MSRFSGLKAQLDPKPQPAPTVAPSSGASTTSRAKARDGKKAVVGYFSEELSRTLRILSVDEGVSVQALLGEAIDLLMRERGKHPFSER